MISAIVAGVLVFISLWAMMRHVHKRIDESDEAHTHGFSVHGNLIGELERRIAKLEAPPVKAPRKPRAKRINEAETSEAQQ